MSYLREKDSLRELIKCNKLMRFLLEVRINNNNNNNNIFTLRQYNLSHLTQLL